MAKLNYECMRDTLIFLENNLDYIDDSTAFKELNWFEVTASPELLVKYSEKEILYVLELLRDGGFIEVPTFRRLPDGNILHFIITNITWNGHEFLATIKNDTVWKRTKEKLKEAGSVAMDTFLFVAKNCATSYFKEKLGLK